MPHHHRSSQSGYREPVRNKGRGHQEQYHSEQRSRSCHTDPDGRAFFGGRYHDPYVFDRYIEDPNGPGSFIPGESSEAREARLRQRDSDIAAFEEFNSRAQESAYWSRRKDERGSSRLRGQSRVRFKDQEERDKEGGKHARNDSRRRGYPEDDWEEEKSDNIEVPPEAIRAIAFHKLHPVSRAESNIKIKHLLKILRYRHSELEDGFEEPQLRKTYELLKHPEEGDRVFSTQKEWVRHLSKRGARGYLEDMEEDLERAKERRHKRGSRGDRKRR